PPPPPPPPPNGERLDVDTEAKNNAALGGERGQRLSELVRVARFIGRRVSAADDPVATRGKRGLERYAFLGGPYLLRDAVLPQYLGRVHRIVETLAVGIDLHDPALQIVIGNSSRRPQFAQRRARV